MSNTNKNLIALLFIIAFMQPFLFKAQSRGSSSARPVAESNEQKAEWHAVKLDDKGGNVINGVEFYTKRGVCNSEKVSFAKLVNTNNYAVKVTYQRHPDSMVVYIMVPASSNIEGSCEATEDNLSKLRVNIHESEFVRQNSKENRRSHIEVSKVQ